MFVSIAYTFQKILSLNVLLLLGWCLMLLDCISRRSANVAGSLVYGEALTTPMIIGGHPEEPSTLSSLLGNEGTISTTSENDYGQPELAPDYCFHVHANLCQQIHVHRSNDSQQRLLLHGGAAESGSKAPCMCRPYTNDNTSWYCCNVSDYAMVTNCRTNTDVNWLHLHIHNMTMPELDVSKSIFQTLQSLAVTNGKLLRVVKAFSRVSQVRCLDFSNNELINVSIRVPPYLKFLNISYNNLTQMPKIKPQLNITLDIR